MVRQHRIVAVLQACTPAGPCPSLAPRGMHSPKWLLVDLAQSQRELKEKTKPSNGKGLKARSTEVHKSPVHLKWSGFYFSSREEQQPLSWK